MKVTEIITESQILNEQLGTFIRFLEMAISKKLGIRGAEGALAWLSKQLVNKSATSASAELAEAWSQTALRMGVPIEEAIKVGEKQAIAAGLDRSIIDTAKAQAGKLFAREAQAAMPGAGGILAKAGDQMQVAKGWLGSNFAMIDKALLAYGVAEPIYTCIYNINECYKRWDAGDPEYKQNPKLLQGDVQLEIDECVQKLVGLWAGRKILGGLFGKYGIQRLPFMGGDTMSATFNAAGAVSKTAFTAWLDTPVGRKAFAEWLVGGSLSAAGFKMVTDLISGLTKTGYDKIVTALGSDKAPDKPDTTPTAPIERPGATKYNLGTGAALN